MSKLGTVVLPNQSSIQYYDLLDLEPQLVRNRSQILRHMYIVCSKNVVLETKLLVQNIYNMILNMYNFLFA